MKEWEPRVVNQLMGSSIGRPRPPACSFLGSKISPPLRPARARAASPTPPAPGRSPADPFPSYLPTQAADEVLEESQVYAEHAGRETVELDDVKLAVEAKLQTEFTRPAGTEEMHEYAASVNRAPMPPLTNRPGIRMPQDDNLLSANYQFFRMRYHARKIAESASRQAPSTGSEARRGRGRGRGRGGRTDGDGGAR